LKPYSKAQKNDLRYAEHANRFNNLGYLPKLSSAIVTGKALGLSRADAVLVSTRVVDALSNWKELLIKEGVDDPDLLNIPEATQGRGSANNR
jgi:hypothetical protein